MVPLALPQELLLDLLLAWHRHWQRRSDPPFFGSEPAMDDGWMMDVEYFFSGKLFLGGDDFKEFC